MDPDSRQCSLRPFLLQTPHAWTQPRHKGPDLNKHSWSCPAGCWSNPGATAGSGQTLGEAPLRIFRIETIAKYATKPQIWFPPRPTGTLKPSHAQHGHLYTRKATAQQVAGSSPSRVCQAGDEHRANRVLSPLRFSLLPSSSASACKAHSGSEHLGEWPWAHAGRLGAGD